MTCADLKRISYRPSLRWQRHNTKTEVGKRATATAKVMLKA